jgi:RNA polymerase sigma factor (sigma-70 family)
MDLSKYYAEICRQPLLSREEELDYFMDLRDEGIPDKRKNQIRDIILKSSLRFVFKQSKYLSKSDPDLFKELISAGNEGLLVALDKFKPESGNRFLSYAGHWIMQRQLKQMSQMRIVSLPICKQQLASKIQKVTENREVEMTFEELKKEFPDTPEKDLRELSQTRYLTYYIDDMTDDPAFEIDPIGTEVEARMDRDRIHALIRELPDQMRQVVELSYGIIDGEESSHTEIAKQMGISKDQLRELKKEGLEILKGKLKGATGS